eukprot:1607806-Pleurochrysis_carterae.AAC.1
MQNWNSLLPSLFSDRLCLSVHWSFTVECTQIVASSLALRRRGSVPGVEVHSCPGKKRPPAPAQRRAHMRAHTHACADTH